MFDSKAHSRDPWSWLSLNRRAVAGAAVAVAGLVAAVLRD
jgi:hypothetical protein